MKKKGGASAVLAAICAVQITAALAASVAQGRRVEHGAMPDPVFYAIGAGFVFLLIFTLIHLSHKPLLISGVTVLIFNMVAVINYYVMLFHGTVLTYQEFKNVRTAFEVVGNYTFRLTPPVWCILGTFFLAEALIVYLRFSRVSWKTDRRLGALSGILLILFSYLVVYSPVRIVPQGGWSLELNYYRYSFVIGTMDNLRRAFSSVRKPDGYDEKLISGASGSAALRSEYPDVILILNETYYDIDHLIGLETDVPYMENYNALNGYKGYAAVPQAGGGTNASEYELLTGNTLSLLNTGTPFNDLDLENSRNIVEYLKKLGYTTMAAHSEPPQNYHRKKAWTDMGFESVYFHEDFSGREYYGTRWFPTDSSVFKDFRRFYEAMPESRPRFAYLLTMQNHGDWNMNDSGLDLVHIENDHGISEYNHERLNEYLTCIKLTDDFIEELTEYFSKTGRDVVICMAGDHSPSFLKEIAADPSVSNLGKRQVPYLIWRNFEADYDGMPENHNIDLCALTPLALLYAGLPISPYYNQLISLSSDVTCLTGITIKSGSKDSDGYVRSDGSTEAINSPTELSEMVRDYYYMVYNNLQGSPRIEKLFDPYTE